MRPPPLASFAVDALPLVDHFVRRLRVEKFLEAYLPAQDRRIRLASAEALGVLLRNLLVCREPLYGVGRWASRFAPSLLGLTPHKAAFLNDDRLGRALDDLFDADRPSLLLGLAARAVREFGLELDRFHNDSTTVSFQGAYRCADGRRVRGRPTLVITFGHSKDHRPDLKQLLWSLTITSDGAVPVCYQALDGNTTDDQTHRTTWDVLRQISGRGDFLYVADSKLCTRGNMLYIAGQGGRFLTVLPANRKEDRRFKDWVQTHAVPWKEVLRRRNSQGKNKPEDVLQAYEDPAGSSEGYRVVWYHSSEKEKRDRQERDEKMERAIRELVKLRDRLAARRTRLRKRKKVDEVVEEILVRTGAQRWIAVEVRREEQERFKQLRPGRPGPQTPYRRIVRVRFAIAWELRQDTLAYDLKTDGVFPLLTSDRKLSPRKILKVYKLGQPRVEHRHHLLKGVHEVAPQYLKSAARIEAFLCVYFVALLVNALIERELRRGMKRRGVNALPLYPEARLCKRPTTEQVLKIFEGLMIHRLRQRGASRVYQGKLSRLQRRILALLGIPTASYSISSI